MQPWTTWLLGLAYALAMSSLLAGAAQQESARPINPSQAHLAYRITDLDGPGTAICYCEPSGILIAATETGTLYSWGKEVTLGLRIGQATPGVLRAHQGPVLALTSAISLLASAGVDNKIVVSSLPDGAIAGELSLATAVRSLALSTDGKRLIGGGDDLVIRVWNLSPGLQSGKLDAPAILKGHADAVLSLCLSSDGKLLASGGYDRSVLLWDLASGTRIRDLPVQPPNPPNTPHLDQNCVKALAFSPDARFLAVGGTDSQIHLVNVADGKIVRSLQGHGSTVTGIGYHPTGNLLISGSRDRTIRLWDTNSGQPIKVLTGHEAWVQGFALMAQNTRLATVGADRSVFLWDLR